MATITTTSTNTSSPNNNNTANTANTANTKTTTPPDQPTTTSSVLTLLTAPIIHLHNLLTTHVLTSPRLTALYTTARAHPLLASFLAAQLLFSGLPIFLFLLGVMVSAALAASVFVCCAGVLLVPVLVFTTVLGVCAWGVFWLGFLGGRWVFRVVGGLDGDGDWKGVDGTANGSGTANGDEVVEVKEEDLLDEKKAGLVVREKEVGDAA